MAKDRLSSTSRCISVDRSTLTSIKRGSSDTDAKALTVIPCNRPSALVVITVTPVGKWPIAYRNDALSREGVTPDPPSFTPKGYGNVAEIGPDFDILAMSD